MLDCFPKWSTLTHPLSVLLLLLFFFFFTMILHLDPLSILFLCVCTKRQKEKPTARHERCPMNDEWRRHGVVKSGAIQRLISSRRFVFLMRSRRAYVAWVFRSSPRSRWSLCSFWHHDETSSSSSSKNQATKFKKPTKPKKNKIYNSILLLFGFRATYCTVRWCRTWRQRQSESPLSAGLARKSSIIAAACCCSPSLSVAVRFQELLLLLLSFLMVNSTHQQRIYLFLPY